MIVRECVWRKNLSRPTTAKLRQSKKKKERLIRWPLLDEPKSGINGQIVYVDRFLGALSVGMIPFMKE